MDGNQSYRQSTESVICLEISQYTFAEVGASACTAISLAALSKILFALKFGNLDNISSNLTNAIFESINSLTVIYGGNRHLSVDELATSLMPPYMHSVSAVPLQGLLSYQYNHFRNAFAEARRLCAADTASSSASSSIGIVITKPPETVCVILPPVSAAVSDSHPPTTTTTTSSSKYYLFDPHARPQLGLDGAYLVSSELEVDILQRLDELFPLLPVDSDCGDYGGGGMYNSGSGYGSNNSGNFGAMMYNMFECWIFQVDG